MASPRAWFLNTSIGARLGWGFTALLVLTLAFGGLALRQMSSLARGTELLFRHPFTVTHAVDEVEIHILKIHREMKDLAHALDPDRIREHQARVVADEEEALRHLDTVRERFLGDPLAVEQLREALVAWRPIRQEVGWLRLQSRFAAADAVTRGKGAEHVKLLEEKIQALKSFAAGKAAESLSSAEGTLQNAFLSTAFLLATAILLGAFVAIAITRSIRNPLAALDQAAARVSDGDLGQQVPIASRDELGRLSRTFNAMVNSIREKTEEVRQKNEENERLLLNILPGPIADRLKRGEEPIADHFPEVTVLFADIAGFTQMSSRLPPGELVALLDGLFTAFDESARRLGVEKIKTIGDAYMAVAGLTHPLENPTAAMVEMAIDMQRAIERTNRERGTTFQVRIGINCGPVVAGVIGKSKFIYDLWGDTVNLASRMESHGVNGRIQLTEEAHQRIRGRFPVEERGPIEVKGKGVMPTWLVVVDAIAS